LRLRGDSPKARERYVVGHHAADLPVTQTSLTLELLEFLQPCGAITPKAPGVGFRGKTTTRGVSKRSVDSDIARSSTHQAISLGSYFSADSVVGRPRQCHKLAGGVLAAVVHTNRMWERTVTIKSVSSTPRVLDRSAQLEDDPVELTTVHSIVGVLRHVFSFDKGGLSRVKDDGP